MPGNTQTYVAFSGADMRAHVGSTEIGTLTGISFSITREKGPVYVAGKPNPVGVGRGRRGIAGSLTFATLNDAALRTVMNERHFHSRVGANPAPGTLVDAGAAVQKDMVERVPLYVDQIPPFNLTITFANESGNRANLSLFGVDILSEGGGFSIEELTLETQMTFIAMSMTRLTPIYPVV